MEFTLDYASLAKKLENQELESPQGRASPQVYGQLLAIYLLFNDLSSAKLLWKRIPTDIKEANEELSIIWQVGKLMWKKSYAEIYPVINSCPTWPNHLKNIMHLIMDSTRQRVVKLISKAYSNISVADASAMLGLSQSDTLKLANELKWVHDEDIGYLSISRVEKSRCEQTSTLDNSNDLLENLTSYIIFLQSGT